MKRFVRFPRLVSQEFRDFVLDTCPALAGDDRRAAAFLGIAEHALFGLPRYDDNALLVPRDTVAERVGSPLKNRGDSAGYWLKAFAAEVFELNIAEAVRWEGKARVMRPNIPADLLAARERELVRERGARRPDRVDFVTGKRVSARELRQIVSLYEHELELAVENTIPGHPGYEMLDLLNQQSPRSLGRVLDANWPRATTMAEAMPTETDKERGKKDSAIRCLLSLQESHRVGYSGSERTARLFARGAPLVQLPGELRRLVLDGNPRLDLRACQLAVVGKLWGNDPLQDCLADPNWSVWQDLLAYMGLDASYKPILKAGLYALIYGMSRRNLRNVLAEGVPAEAAGRFFKHPLIQVLLDARDLAIQRVHRQGGALDAFDRWIPVDLYQPHQILAQQAQSYELRIMIAALPVLQQADVSVLCWLHDGMVVRVQNRSKEERRVRQIIEAVNAAAQTLGIRTALEWDR